MLRYKKNVVITVDPDVFFQLKKAKKEQGFNVSRFCNKKFRELFDIPEPVFYTKKEGDGGNER